MKLDKWLLQTLMSRLVIVKDQNVLSCIVNVSLIINSVGPNVPVMDVAM